MVLTREKLLVVVAAACSAPPRPPAAEVAPANRALASSPLGRDCGAAEVSREAHYADGIFVDAPSQTALVCGEYREHCSVTFEVTITNCRRDAITVNKLGYYSLDMPYISTTAGFPHDVAPRTAWTIEVTTRGEGEVTVPLHVTSTAYRELTYVGPGVEQRVTYEPYQMVFDVGSGPITVTNPALDAAIAACKACNGDWGHHSMAVTIDPSPGADQGMTCVCRSTDGGTECDDGDDCQGWCEFERWVSMGRRGAVDIGYAVGRCSEFTSMRSCVHPIPNGASKQPPGPREDQEMCID